MTKEHKHLILVDSETQVIDYSFATILLVKSTDLKSRDVLVLAESGYFKIPRPDELLLSWLESRGFEILSFRSTIRMLTFLEKQLRFALVFFVANTSIVRSFLLISALAPVTWLEYVVPAGWILWINFDV